MNPSSEFSRIHRRAGLATGLALLIGTAWAEMPQPEVIGGTQSLAWPGMGALVTIQGVDFYECSATLIAPQWVLTAAHCLDVTGTPMFTMAQDYAVPSATFYTSDAMYIHPSYVLGGGASQPYDVGLVHFPTPIPAMPYRLNDNAGLVQSGAAFQFIGYGQARTGPPGSDNNSLRHLGAATVSQLDTHGMDSQAGAHACFGDSGSAWFIRHSDGYPLLIGVQSYFSGNCDSIFHADATADALPFISSHVTDLCLTSTVGAPCDGIFRSDLEAAP